MFVFQSSILCFENSVDQDQIASDEDYFKVYGQIQGGGQVI